MLTECYLHDHKITVVQCTDFYSIFWSINHLIHFRSILSILFNFIPYHKFPSISSFWSALCYFGLVCRLACYHLIVIILIAYRDFRYHQSIFSKAQLSSSALCYVGLGPVWKLGCYQQKHIICYRRLLRWWSWSCSWQWCWWSRLWSMMLLTMVNIMVKKFSISRHNVCCGRVLTEWDWRSTYVSNVHM